MKFKAFFYLIVILLSKKLVLLSEGTFLIFTFFTFIYFSYNIIGKIFQIQFYHSSMKLSNAFKKVFIFKKEVLEISRRYYTKGAPVRPYADKADGNITKFLKKFNKFMLPVNYVENYFIEDQLNNIYIDQVRLFNFIYVAGLRILFDIANHEEIFDEFTDYSINIFMEE